MRVLLLLFLAICCIGLLVSFNRKNKSVGVISGVLFSFLLYYCIVPIVFYSTAQKSPSGYVLYILKADSYVFISGIACCAMFLLVLGVTYRAYRYKRNSYYIIDDRKILRLSSVWRCSANVGIFRIYAVFCN